MQSSNHVLRNGPGGVLSICLIGLFASFACGQYESPPGAQARGPSTDAEAGGSDFPADLRSLPVTGADDCSLAQVVEVQVGALGSPIMTTIEGSNVDASGQDCSFLTAAPLWWEAFHLDQCARVTLDFCGTIPVQQPGYTLVFNECPCQYFLGANAAARGGPICIDNEFGDQENLWMTFNALPAGTYYYPVFSDETALRNGRGPYTIHITAEECVGACCDSETRGCVDHVKEADCQGFGRKFGGGRACCEQECRPDDVLFDASDVTLFSWVGFDRFPEGPYQTSDLTRYLSPTGREYVMVGFTTGTGFVEITRPLEPVVVGWIDGNGVDSIWRDPTAFGGFAYVVTDGIGVGLQVADIRQIDDGVVSLVNTTRLLDDQFYTAHNIFVNEASGFAYLCGANYPSDGLVALDLSDPVSPTVAGWWGDVYVHDVQVVTLTKGPNAGREIAFAFAGGDGLFILDVADKTDISFVSQLYYDGLAYCHQGWLAPDERNLFINDELDEVFGTTNQTTTYVVNVEDLFNPVVIATFSNGGCAIDHNLMVRGQTVYEANYSTGMRVFDASNPINSVEVGHFDSHPEDNIVDFVGAWGLDVRYPSGVVTVSDVERGLFVLNFDCNDNGKPDTAELSNGALDCNANSFLDSCEFLVPGDLDRDRRVSLPDHAELRSCLAKPCPMAGCAPPKYDSPCCVHVDLDHDGDVDLHDVWAFDQMFTGR